MAGEHGKVTELWDEDEARALAKTLDIDLEKIPLRAFRRGLVIEMEHTDVTKGDLKLTGMISRAHLRERPDYYALLDKYVES